MSWEEQWPDRRRVDWSNSEDRALALKELSLAERLRLLDRLVPDRTCPVCLEYRETWKIRHDGKLAVCANCFGAAGCRVRLPKRRVGCWPLSEDLLELDGEMLTLAREALGLSLETFGRGCGWSKSRQRAMEEGRKTVNYGVGLRIQRNLEKFGLST